MSVTYDLPDDSLFLPSVNIFTADYNSPTAGKYDFGVAANSGVDVQGISPGFLYFISIINFGANIGEGVFLENIEDIPRVQFFTKLSGKSLYGGGYPIANYLKNNDISAFFWTPEKADFLTATFTGVLGQNASLAGIPEIAAHVSLNMFQISDKSFISRFFKLAKADDKEGGMITLGPGWDKRI